MSSRTPRAVLLIAALAAAVAFGAQTPSREKAPEADPRHEADDTGPRGRSKQEILIQDPLHAIAGKEAHLLRIEYPAGWVGRRHYHTGDVFLYVLEGAFTIELEGGKRTTIERGEAYHEAVKTEMQARNASATEPTTILLFQIGDRGERLTVVTD